MEIGTKLQIEFTAPTIERGMTEVVGGKRGQFLIIELPEKYDRTDRHEFLEPGCVVIIRFINQNGVIYGAKAEVMKVMYEPVRLMMITYPSIVENHNLRQDHRSNCLLHSTIIIGDETHNAYIVNISTKGCGLAFDKTKISHDLLEACENFDVTFQLPGVSDEISLSVQTKNLITEDKRYLLGGTFGDINPVVMQHLSSFVSKLEAFIEDDWLL